MPVSVTEKAITAFARARIGWPALQPEAACQAVDLLLAVQVRQRGRAARRAQEHIPPQREPGLEQVGQAVPLGLALSLLAPGQSFGEGEALDAAGGEQAGMFFQPARALPHQLRFLVQMHRIAGPPAGDVRQQAGLLRRDAPALLQASFDLVHGQRAQAQHLAA